MQTDDSAAPIDVEKVPAEHAWQASEEFAPAPVEYVPVLHAVHIVFSVSHLTTHPFLV